MTDWDKGFAVGFIVAFLTSMIGIGIKAYQDRQPSAEQLARTYTAYRACIQRSTCQMTPQDWIDYYELKWRLEEKQIERTQE